MLYRIKSRSVLILYQGLREKYYYWEMVNVSRKIIILAINILVTKPVYKALFGTLFAVLLIKRQLRVKPYKLRIMNKLESAEYTASAITLFGSIIFT